MKKNSKNTGSVAPGSMNRREFVVRNMQYLSAVLASPLLQLLGQDQSEITGPAFSPDGTRLYFSSQRGTTGHSADGITYEVTGPIFST